MRYRKWGLGFFSPGAYILSINFHSTSAELPSIAVTYRQPSSAYSPNLSSSHKDKSKFLSLDKTADRLRTIFRPSQSPSHSNHHHNSPRRTSASFQSYVKDLKSSHPADDEEEKLSSGSSSRRVSSDSDSTGEGAVISTSGAGGSVKGYSRTDSLERRTRLSYHHHHHHHRSYERTNLRRTGSSETVSSQSTLVQPRDCEIDDSSMAITDILQSGIGRQSLTESRVHAQERLYERRPRRNLYDYRRKEMFAAEKERSREVEQLQNVSEDSGELASGITS